MHYNKKQTLYASITEIKGCKSSRDGVSSDVTQNWGCQPNSVLGPNSPGCNPLSEG
jgi:hypothetical protein